MREAKRRKRGGTNAYVKMGTGSRKRHEAAYELGLNRSPQ